MGFEFFAPYETDRIVKEWAGDDFGYKIFSLGLRSDNGDFPPEPVMANVYLAFEAEGAVPSVATVRSGAFEFYGFVPEE